MRAERGRQLVSQPESPLVRFETRVNEMATIGYYMERDSFGNDSFISDTSNNIISAEDVLLADWANWRALFRRAEAEA